MNSPDPNNVNIRLEISVPTGVNVRMGPGTGLPFLGSGIIKLFFDLVGDPSTGLAFPSPNICVRTSTGSALGAVAIFFTYPSAPFAVKAINYPYLLDHADETPPSGAQPGTPSTNNTVWTWTNLVGVDHTQSPNTARNVVRLWTQATSTSAWVPDTNTFTFYGYSGSGSPCGSSGSGAFSVAAAAGQPGLLLQVLDGPKAGRYRAKAIASLKWEVAIAGTAYQIHMTPDGATAFFGCPSTTVMSKAAGNGPFYAVFPGSIVGASNDVVAFQE